MLAPSAGSSVFQRGAERAQGPPVQRIGLLGIPKHIKLLKERLHGYINQSSRLINRIPRRSLDIFGFLKY